MSQGYHRLKRHNHEEVSQFLAVLDRSMYIIALIAPVMTVPQLIDVFSGHTEGVSLLTWGAYAAVSALWCIYGFLHKDRPLLLTQFLLLVLDTAIFFGVLLHL